MIRSEPQSITAAHPVHAMRNALQDGFAFGHVALHMDFAERDCNPGSFRYSAHAINNEGRPVATSNSADCISPDQVIAFVPRIGQLRGFVGGFNASHGGQSVVGNGQFYDVRPKFSPRKFDASSEPRCVCCRSPQGNPHVKGCPFAKFTIRKVSQ